MSILREDFDLDTMLIDDFLDSYRVLRAYADTAVYADIQNTVDAVTYPGICADIPAEVSAEVTRNLSLYFGSKTKINYLFLRLSLAGVAVPHQAHTDISMGQYSLMLYMNRKEDCRGGTALVGHVDGMYRNPENAEQEAIWKRDTNNPKMWTTIMLAEMRPNRAFIFDAALMHRAEPVGGFGKNAKDGRLVLTAFFNR